MNTGKPGCYRIASDRLVRLANRAFFKEQVADDKADNQY